jgi:aminomethyltransferase
VNAELESTPEPLDAWHRQHGASWREEAGVKLVASYGNPQSELASLTSACGLIARPWIGVFEVSGEDRLRFLNGYLTCDVSALAPGAGTYGFFTDAQGRILADAMIAARPDSLRVAVAAGRVQPLIEHLSRYIIADRVELAARTDDRQLLMAGAGAENLLDGLLTTGAPEARELETWSWASVRVAECDVEIQRERALGVPLFVVWTCKPDAAVVAEEIASRGASPVGFDALESQRILAGVPRYGADFDDARFPQETGLEEAISYTKGCYLGQEVVARIHYRGHVNHELRALRGAGGSRPRAGAVIELEGQEVGRLGSVTSSPSTGEIVGLAILHRKAAAPGTEVRVANDRSMRVEDPGFAVAAVV